MTLSILVISHNQKDLLRRCLDSILAQDLPFEHEIIVSDDASTDGTWELILEYQATHPEIKGYQCNSDDCNPANNSQRSGWNRCNAYKHARGKYIVHVDGDDYFRPSADVYKKQISALENNPECYLAMSKVVWKEEGQALEDSGIWHLDTPLEEGMILSGEDIIAQHLFIINQAFMMRRNVESDPVELYGKRYVDAIITFHHLQFGPAIYVDACDYVYEQHSTSVTGITSQNADQLVVWCLGIYVPTLIPRWRQAYYLADYNGIRDVISLARRGHQLSEKNKKGLEGLKPYIYGTFNRPLSHLDRFRLFSTTTYMRLMKKFHLTSKSSIWILHKLIAG